ncbi:MAG: hypothetical protein NTY77_07725 [Elusimicrobia bacterium]|nr:hypothetical protein [Elusimicrobiota bacterium]
MKARFYRLSVIVFSVVALGIMGLSAGKAHAKQLDGNNNSNNNSNVNVNVNANVNQNANANVNVNVNQNTNNTTSVPQTPQSNGCCGG